MAAVKEIGIDYMQGFGVAGLVELEAPTQLKPAFTILKLTVSLSVAWQPMRQ